MPADSHIAGPGVEDLVTANRILANEGVLDAFGHVSVRHPEQPDQFAISRSLGPELVTPEDLQVFTLDTNQVAGNPQAAYSERAIHAAVYAARPDVLAVCHNHAASLIPFGVTGTPLRPIFHMAGVIGTDIPVWDIAVEFGDTDLLVRNLDQGRSLAATLGARRVALMRGHGAVVAARSLKEAVVCAIYLAHNARLLLDASLLAPGNVKGLTPGEAEKAAGMWDNQSILDRAWSTWARRVGRG